VAPLYEQAAIAAQTLLDRRAHYRGSSTATSLKVSGISLFSAGDIAGGPDTQSITVRDPARGLYRRLLVCARGPDTVLSGAILVGETGDGAWYAELIAHETPLGAMRHELIFGRAFAETSLAA
jgi:nitrite reductase (NADH) large subunit